MLEAHAMNPITGWSALAAAILCFAAFWGLLKRL